MRLIMKKERVYLVCLLLLFLQGWAADGYGAPDEGRSPERQAKRSVTVADAIQMTNLGDPYYWEGGSSRGIVARFSPDGKRFVVVLRTGNAKQNTNDYSMLLWRTEDVFVAPSSTLLLTMSSSSNRPAIQDVEWLPDNKTVEFVGEHPGEKSQLYTLNVETRILKRVSDSPDNILAYGITRNGDRTAYVAEMATEDLFDEKARREGVDVSTQPLFKLLVGQKGQGWGQQRNLFLQSTGGKAHPISTAGKIEYGNGKNNPHFSPDGKYIVLLLHPQEFSERWRGYSDPDLQKALSAIRAPGQTTWITRYELIDTTTGKDSVLLDVPQESWNTEIAWSPDSQSVVISNTYLPLDATNVEDYKARQVKKFAVELRISGGELIPISEQGDLTLLAWDGNSNQLVFESDRSKANSKPLSRVVWQKIAGKWQRVKDVLLETVLPEIVLEEDMNTPPKLFGGDQRSRKRTLLLDLNPGFGQLKFSKIEEITWKNSEGVEIKGGLYYPVDYVPGKRYPLVIQTHGWTRDRFWIDGPWTTAFAAQSLAGKGIMVLQGEKLSEDDSWWSKVTDTPKEVQVEVDGYEKAIDYLDANGLVDSNRVGIIGFSRTCLYIKYALTHSKYRFAAASVTDGADGGYFQYLTSATDNPGYALEMEGINGGLPFGEGLKSWIRNSPGFNVDKVQTPLRIVALRPASALFEWEWFAALRRLGKPVDMVMLQDGEHLLQKPWERMISQQGNVDWFRFWLQGYEDPDPTKAEQYGRWRELRKLQQPMEAERKPN